MATRTELIKRYNEMERNCLGRRDYERANKNKDVSIDLQEMDSLFDKVEEWAEARNLHTQDPAKQMLKVMEEVGELAQGMAKGDETQVTDSVGDAIVTLIVLASQLGYRAEECLQLAYDEIKDRRGKMVNGVFVKEEDLIK